MSTFARRLMLWKVLVAATEPLPLAELARRLGVSKNTAQRDLDALSGAGVPVLEERRGQRLLFRVDPGADWSIAGNADRPALRRPR
jgi:predicted DNA-binding transcriptional regulator YafY